MRRPLAIASTLIVACASSGNFDQLPQRDQDRFYRCWSSMQRTACDSGSASVYVATCKTHAEASYAERLSDPGRRSYLLEQGCPASLVDEAPVGAGAGAGAAPATSGAEALPAEPPVAVGTVTTTRDRFTGRNVVQLSGMVVETSSGNRLELRMSSVPSQSDVEVLLRAYVGPGRPAYGGCYAFDILADGAAVPNAAETYSLDARGVETIATRIGLSDLTRIAQAQNVEGRLCQSEFRLGSGQVAKLRELVQAAAPAAQVAPQGDAADAGTTR